MVFVLDTAIGLGVWLPFTIGKSTALLSVSALEYLKIPCYNSIFASVGSSPIPANHTPSHTRNEDYNRSSGRLSCILDQTIFPSAILPAFPDVAQIFDPYHQHHFHQDRWTKQCR